MSFDQDVKELAYTLDPDCWISYSGKPKDFKQAMELRRAAALQKAEFTLPLPETEEIDTLWGFRW